MFRNLPQPRARIWDFCFFKITLGPFFLWLLNSREFPACISFIFFLPFPSFASVIPFCLKARSSAAARGPVSLSSGVTRAAAWSCQCSEVESPNGYLSECNNVNLLVVILRGKNKKQKKTTTKKLQSRELASMASAAVTSPGALPLPQGRAQSAVSIATWPRPAAALAGWPWSGAGPAHHRSPHPEPRELAHGKSFGLAGPEASL